MSRIVALTAAVILVAARGALAQDEPTYQDTYNGVDCDPGYFDEDGTFVDLTFLTDGTLCCRQAWCNSAFDDCIAGANGEKCDCDIGSARELYDVGNDGYVFYMCCQGGDNDGRKCGENDNKKKAASTAGAVILAIILVLVIGGIIAAVVACCFCCEGCPGHHSHRRRPHAPPPPAYAAGHVQMTQYAAAPQQQPVVVGQVQPSPYAAQPVVVGHAHQPVVVGHAQQPVVVGQMQPSPYAAPHAVGQPSAPVVGVVVGEVPQARGGVKV